MARVTAAFLSYHHEVDALGNVTRFRKALEQGVRERGWEDFAVFQDREDIQWGDDWQDRVRTSLDDVLLLLPVISPGLFQSEPCKLEMSTFLEREAHNPASKQIVLPVYFVTTRAYENATDSLASKLRNRIYLDFRELRIRGTEDREYRQAILKASDRVADLLSDSAAIAPPTIAPVGFEEPPRPEARFASQDFATTQPNGPSRRDTRRTPKKWRRLGLVTSVTGRAALAVLLATIFPPGRHPAPPGSTGATARSASENSSDDCPAASTRLPDPKGDPDLSPARDGDRVRTVFGPGPADRSRRPGSRFRLARRARKRRRGVLF